MILIGEDKTLVTRGTWICSHENIVKCCICRLTGLTMGSQSHEDQHCQDQVWAVLREIH